VLYFLTPALATRRRKLGALEGAELDRTGTGSQRRSRGCARLRRLLQLVRFELALQGCPAPWIGHHRRVCGECSTTRKKYATDEPARTNTTDVRDFDLALRSSPRPALATSRTTSRPNDGHPPLPRRHRLRVLSFHTRPRTYAAFGALREVNLNDVSLARRNIGKLLTTVYSLSIFSGIKIPNH